jgi:monoamine oxidase
VLDTIGASGWLRRLIDIGLTQEMGLEPERMSGLYVVEYFAPDPAQPQRGLFSSDQRFQVAGGNDRLPAAIARGSASGSARATGWCAAAGEVGLCALL